MMIWRPVRTVEWRIHVGAHKTATTHFQDTLAALRPELLEQGTDYLPRAAVRPVFNRLFRPERWSFRRGGLFLLPGLARDLASLRQGGGRVALSEENLLGHSHHLLTSDLYPWAARNLRALSALGVIAPMTLFLSIRSFDRILPGAYATALRFGGQSTLRFTEKQAQLGDQSPSWIPLVETILRSAPRARVHLWQQETYAVAPGATMTAFLGHDPGILPDLPPPVSTLTPSTEAIVEVEQRLAAGRRRELGANAWRDEVDEVYRTHPVGAGGKGRFSPFSESQQNAMRAAYAQDIDDIRVRWPGMLIEPK